ncbi:MAG: hypothetical protein ACM3ML_03460 [Micromonosporaceae bacterium]
MSVALDKLPLLGEQGRMSVRGMAAGGMLVTVMRFPAGTDLRALGPDVSCPCPHWGLVLEGTAHIQLADGTEEVAEKGSVYYLPPGHVPWFDVETTLLEFSPEEQQRAVLAEVAERLGAALAQ